MSHSIRRLVAPFFPLLLLALVVGGIVVFWCRLERAAVAADKSLSVQLDESVVAVAVRRDDLGKVQDFRGEGYGADIRSFRRSFQEQGILILPRESSDHSLVGSHIELQDISDFEGKAVVLGAPLVVPGSETLLPLTGEILVMFETRLSEEELERFRTSHGFVEVRENVYFEGLYVFRPPEREPEAVLDLVREIAHDQRVEAVDANVFLPLGPSEHCAIGWHLDSQDLEEVGDIDWLRAKEILDDQNLRPTTIAVIDYGFVKEHPGLSSERIIEGLNLSEGEGLEGSCNRHGMAVAGLAAGNWPAEGISGVCPHCKVLQITLPGLVPADVVADALGFARSRNPDVLIGSWGGNFLEAPESLDLLVEQVATEGRMFADGRPPRGLPMIFAVGNGGSEAVGYPARHPMVLGVGASDCTGDFWCYSSHGNGSVGLDLLAPSGGLSDCQADHSERCGLRTLGEADLTCFGGTSAAAPIVAGVAALLLSLDPDLTREEVLRILLETGDTVPAAVCDGEDFVDASRRVNAFRAVCRVLADLEIAEPRCGE